MDRQMDIPMAMSIAVTVVLDVEVDVGTDTVMDREYVTICKYMHICLCRNLYDTSSCGLCYRWFEFGCGSRSPSFHALKPKSPTALQPQALNPKGLAPQP